jgi:serine protease Do
MMDGFENNNNNLNKDEEQKEQELQREGLVQEEPEVFAEPVVEEPQPINSYEVPPQASIKPRKEAGRKHTGLSYLAVGLIGSLIGGFIMAAIAPAYLYGKIIPFPQSTVSQNNMPMGQQLVINPTQEVSVATAVAKKNMPAVVGISTISVVQDFWGVQRQSEGVGSGFVVNANGYIITNAHVVGDNPKNLTVYFMDGKELPGTVLWKDTALDMAVVKVEATNLPIVELGDSDTIDVGETAIAIGNPLGLRYERTVTQGIISGLNRSIQVSSADIMEDLIQTDAAINPGNSGGPLINNEGKIIGINTAKASAEGLGFAIPINIAKPIINQLINEGTFKATYLGIGLVDREIAGYLDTNIEIKKGIYITSVMAGYPADKAGLKAEDIITQVDNIEVNTMVKFKSVLYSKKPGDKVSIIYERDGKAYRTEATLIAKPEE